MNRRSLDGLIGEGWSGVDPDGAHVNVVLAERGTSTAASLIGTFTSPAPGHAPILVVVGETKDQLRAGVAADDHDQQGDRARADCTRRSPGARASSGSRRACSTRSPRS